MFTAIHFFYKHAMRELISVISGVAIIQLLLFFIFILIGRYKFKKQLAVFIGTNILFLSAFFIGWEHWSTGKLMQIWIDLFFCSGYFFGPSLYSYIATVLGLSVQRPKRLYLSSFLLTAAYVAIQIFSVVSEQPPRIAGVKISFFLVLCMHLQILVFMYLLINLLKMYREKIEAEFSNLGRYKINWIYWVVFAFVGMWFIDFSGMVLNTIWGLPLLFHHAMTLLSVGINALFANVTIFKGLSQPNLFAESDPGISLTAIHPVHPASPPEELKIRLLSVMETQKPYLEPEITLGDLALKTGINTKYLSQILNDQLGKNFYEFINAYRVEEAKKMLSDTSLAEKTVLEILYDCGFNSKSVFNNVFKKNTGVTPTQFRNRKIARIA